MGVGVTVGVGVCVCVCECECECVCLCVPLSLSVCCVCVCVSVCCVCVCVVCLCVSVSLSLSLSVGACACFRFARKYSRRNAPSEVLSDSTASPRLIRHVFSSHSRNPRPSTPNTEETPPRMAWGLNLRPRNWLHRRSIPTAAGRKSADRNKLNP